MKGNRYVASNNVDTSGRSMVKCVLVEFAQCPRMAQLFIANIDIAMCTNGILNEPEAGDTLEVVYEAH